MGHKAHVGLVDAHAERDGGHHHDAVLAQEAVLVLLAHLGGQARVVGQRRQARIAQRLGQFLHALAGLAIDHAGLAQVLAVDEAHELRERLLLFLDAVADVGPVEADDELPRLLQPQALHDVLARERVRRGREGDARHARIALVQHRELAVLGPEVVAPLAHAVRLVDGEQPELPARMQTVQQREKAVGGHALGRGVQQRDLAARQAPLHVLRLLPVQRGVEEGRLHPRLVQRAHLVVHQRNERRDHHRHAQPRIAPHDGRHLVAQALAAARGHQHQRVAAGDHMVDDGLLRATELLVAKDVVQDEMRGGQTGGLSF